MLKRVLYWPGIRRTADELKLLREGLIRAGHAMEWLGVPYDEGSPPDSPDGPIAEWLAQSEPAYWWIGLSLGAGVAHISAAISAHQLQPRRITLINPVADRCALARLRRFSMDTLWDLRASRFIVPHVRQLDIVLSTEDTQVPRDHGLSLLKCYPNAQPRLTEIRADHSISDPEQQNLLLRSLLSAADD